MNRRDFLQLAALGAAASAIDPETLLPAPDPPGLCRLRSIDWFDKNHAVPFQLAYADLEAAWAKAIETPEPDLLDLRRG